MYALNPACVEDVRTQPCMHTANAFTAVASVITNMTGTAYSHSCEASMMKIHNGMNMDKGQEEMLYRGGQGKQPYLEVS